MALVGAPAVVTLATVSGNQSSPTAASTVGLVAGALLLMATATFYVLWLSTPLSHHGWIVSAMAVLSFQTLVSAGRGLLAPETQIGTQRWTSPVDLTVTAVALVVAILGTREVRFRDPMLLGVGLGTAVTLLHVTELLGPALGQPSVILEALTLLTILAGHVWIAHMMWRDCALPDWVRARLAATVCLIGFAHVAPSGLLDRLGTDLADVAALAGAATLWTGTALVLLRQTLDDQHQRSLGLEGSLLEMETGWRGSREQLHEIRNTVAGAASACRLLSDETVGVATHAKLERGLRAELDRLERLVAERPPVAPGPVDIDATLEVLLASHRARGRTITWEPTGATVHARPDDVAEALNILLDNAATHGGAASSVAVTHANDLVLISVSDKGPGVPPEWRDQIFDWGVHGAESPGQGIGLNLARRLMSEQGGSLSLAEPTTEGSSFVIRLPAARCSEESHARDAGR